MSSESLSINVTVNNDYAILGITNQLWKVNKWMAKRWPFSIQGCLSRFSWIMTAKNTKKIRISYGQWLLKFPRSGSKTKYEKKNWKLHTWPGQWYVFAAENENRQLKDLPQTVFGHIRGNIYSFGNYSFFFPIGLSKDVSKQTKGTKN